jgi:hypothetical protein
MIKQIRVWKVIVLSIVTFGIYNTVWLAKRRNEMVENYDVSIPDWWWLVAPSLLSFALYFILFFIESASPSQFGPLIIFMSLMTASLVVSGILLWWLWQFGKAAEKITQGKVTLGWVMIYVLLLGGCIQYVLQYYFNRLPKAPTTKQYEPSKRFVKYSIVAIVVLYIFWFGAGVAMSALGTNPSWMLSNKQNAQYLKSVQLLQEYNGCIDNLNNDFHGEIAEGEQQAAYDKAASDCEAIRARQNTAADGYNASTSE